MSKTYSKADGDSPLAIPDHCSQQRCPLSCLRTAFATADIGEFLAGLEITAPVDARCSPEWTRIGCLGRRAERLVWARCPRLRRHRGRSWWRVVEEGAEGERARGCDEGGDSGGDGREEVCGAGLLDGAVLKEGGEKFRITRRQRSGGYRFAWSSVLKTGTMVETSCYSLGSRTAGSTLRRNASTSATSSEQVSWPIPLDMFSQLSAKIRAPVLLTNLRTRATGPSAPASATRRRHSAPC